MKIRLVAPFTVPGLDEQGRLEIPQGATVASVMKRAKTGSLPWNLLPVSVNGRQVKRSNKLNDGDIVVFISPISGG